MTLLDELVVARGGLEAADVDGDQPGSLSQEDFESFFHQIRRFLTVQEQIDLFSRWFEAGAADAGFLTVLALTAAGFSRRKPEFLEQARERMQTLANADLDPMPLLGVWICCWATSRMRSGISPSCGIRICRPGS